MRGAPQVGFSATIRKIRARTSLLTPFRPPTRLNLEIHVQYKRNPAPCQFTTLRGVTNTRGFLHPDQSVLNATQNSLCRAVNRVRGRCACKASSCWRRAKFSRTRSSRERKELTIHPRRCRSDTIMARIISELSEFSFFAKSFILQVYDVLARMKAGIRGSLKPAVEPELPRKLAAQEIEMIEAAPRESRGRVTGPSGAAAKLGIPGS